MNNLVFLLLAFKLLVIACAYSGVPSTADRIRMHGYIAESHTVQTSDGYILTMFRIPYTKGSNGSTSVRPIAFLSHGMVGSSDSFILNGPGEALVYLLADAGYDVWLGNNRGNTYSEKHIRYPRTAPQFWSFNWDQIAVYDTPAMMDYALRYTNQKSLHFVGFSLGTTVLFVLTSMRPSYNGKIKSAQMIAPVAFMSNMKGPLVSLTLPLFGRPNPLALLMENTEFPLTKSFVREYACTKNFQAARICTQLVFGLIYGSNKNCFNMTHFSEIVSTHPAGSSSNLPVQYLQQKASKSFRQFDYGWVRNKIAYGQTSPPEYNIERITAPTFLYYAMNDVLASYYDVQRLMKKLPNLQYSFRVPNPDWNHFDFLWGNNVKEIIFNRVIRNINKMERGFSAR